MDATFDSGWRERALAGDPAALGALVDAALHPLWRFCFARLGGDHHLCEEVVQEALLRALRDLARYEPVRSAGDPLPWLVGLARNEVRRARGRERGAASAAPVGFDDDLLRAYAQVDVAVLPPECLERAETRGLVQATLERLSEGHREALEGKYVLDQSVRCLARSWSVSEKAAESRLSRARAAFREVFRSLTGDVRVEAS